VARNPNGWTSDLSPIGDAVRRMLHLEGGSQDGPPSIDLRESDAEPSHEEVRELARTAS
jgi:hypothetical protein